MNNQQLWDKKAQSFPRFVKDDKDTLEILDFFTQQGVDFTQKTLLDIGCGNGRFSLQLAQSAKHIYATDISQAMLAHLQEDARALGLENITTILSSWEEYGLDSEKDIDIAFASMTPALNNLNGVKKALHCAKIGLCYVGWGRIRKSEFLDEILQAHNLKLELPTGLPQMLEWLKELGYKLPHYTYKSAHFTTTASVQKAIEDVKWHVGIHGGEADSELIAKYVEKKQQNGFISYVQEREIGMCFIPAWS